jgi:hypothetical protein
MRNGLKLKGFASHKITCPVCGKEGFFLKGTGQVLHKSVKRGRWGLVRASSLCEPKEAA